MADTVCPSKRGWKDVAVEYAEAYGWRIVPLHPQSELSEEWYDNSIVTQLGYQPLIEIPEGATARPEEIRAWNGVPQALIGVLAGPASDLVALEIPVEEEGAITEDQLCMLKSDLPETRALVGPEREYFLFSYPEDCVHFAGMRRSNGLVLHGANSIIPVPGPASKRRRTYRWLLTAGEDVAPLPSSLKALFGVSRDLEAVLSNSEPSSGSGVGDKKDRQGEQPCGGLSASGPESNGTSAAAPTALRSTGDPRGDGSVSFRSGDELKGEEGASSDLGLSWLSEGALTVLAGSPKTTGKSTFVTNLVSHLVMGRMFLEKELQSSPVVMLSDVPPSQFRDLLSAIGVSRDALSQLHVLHPRDASQCSWRPLMEGVFTQAVQAGAALVVIDSLDQYIEAKCGLEAVSSDEVVSTLTTEAPSECATLAVKSVPVNPTVPMKETIEHLSLLGTAADLIVRMDETPTSIYPTLRRFQFCGRIGDLPSHMLCELIRGRYQRFRRTSMRASVTFEGPSEQGRSGFGSRETGTKSIGPSGKQGRLGLLPSNGHTNGTTR